MFASVLGYAFQGNGNEENSNVEYNGFEFVKQDNSWILEDNVNVQDEVNQIRQWPLL